MAQMKKPVGKVKKTQAQIDAELAASKKAFEKYKATRPSKAKLAEMYTEQQSRLRRSKTVAPKPLTGPAAVKALQDRVSPAGVKKAETGAKKAIDKKYPGLYKKSK